ncbi:ATP-binding protein [Clavibacter tessellarius]|uniref:ATP-binding protein n=1 Tax=Clavibacter tessellarius TaxID=31965 RepID=UPI003250B38A
MTEHEVRPVHDYVSEKWNNVSLRTKITGVTVLLLLLGLLVSGAGTMYLLRQQMVIQLDAQLRIAATQLPKILGTDQATPETFTQDDVETADSTYFVLLLDAQGDVIADNWAGGSASHPRVFDLDLARASERNEQIVQFSDNAGKATWHGIVRVSQNAGPNTTAYSTLIVAKPLSEVDDLVATYIVIFASFGLAVVVLGAAVTRMLVTSTFGPLRQVERTAAAIAEGDFGQRLGGATPNTEVGRLNRSLNTMLSRIDRAFADRAKTIDQMRRFVGDASHELRTLLVSVRGYAEPLPDGRAADARGRVAGHGAHREGGDPHGRARRGPPRAGAPRRDEAAAARPRGPLPHRPRRRARRDGLIPDAHGHRAPARAREPGRSDPRRRRPRAHAGDVARRPPRRRGGERRHRPDRLRGRHAVPTAGTTHAPPGRDGDRRARLRLPRCRWRPCRRGLRHGLGRGEQDPPGGHEPHRQRRPVHARRQPDRGSRPSWTSEPREARIEVRDHGDGVPPQIREKIFQRFWRADTSRTRETGGSGLGLAIVSAIVAAHRGRVDVVETEGGGATFRVILPLLPSSDAPSPSTTTPQTDPAA